MRTSSLRSASAVAALFLLAGCDEGATSTSGRGSGGAGGEGTAPTTALSSSTASAATGTASSSSGSSSSGSSSSGSSGTGGKPPVCPDYPVQATMPDTFAAAQAELQSFAPNATLQWNSLHGTLGLVMGLGVPLDCSMDVWTAAWKVFDAHPALFQLDASEWAKPAPFGCAAVTSNEIVSTYREKLAGVGVQKDVLSLVLAPLPGGGVELRGVSGFYLPVLDPGDLTSCPNLDDATATALLSVGPYTYSTFDQCTPTGAGAYTPSAADVLTLGPETWVWEDGPSGIVARKRRTATLIIDPSHWTPGLLASDANCPDATGEERVLGFVLTFDPVTGEILDVKPGVGCIVC